MFSIFFIKKPSAGLQLASYSGSFLSFQQYNQYLYNNYYRFINNFIRGGSKNLIKKNLFISFRYFWIIFKSIKFKQFFIFYNFEFVKCFVNYLLNLLYETRLVRVVRKAGSKKDAYKRVNKLNLFLKRLAGGGSLVKLYLGNFKISLFSRRFFFFIFIALIAYRRSHISKKRLRAGPNI